MTDRKPLRDPIPLGTAIHELLDHIEAMSRADDCPTCPNKQPPTSWQPRGSDTYQCAYTCDDCGHAWAAEWKRST